MPMTLPKGAWTDMTWEDIASAGDAVRRWIAVLPLAAVEQHRPQLPLGVDSFISEAYLSRVLEILRQPSGDFFADPAYRRLRRTCGLSGYANDIGGDCGRRLEEIGESLARAGVRKLVLVTSHGGNVAAMELVARNLRARFGMLAVTVGWHRFGYPPETFSGEERKHGIHGGDIETSLMLAARPDTVRMNKAAHAAPASLDMADEFRWLSASRPAGFAWMTQDLHTSGALGDATLATAAKGEAALVHGARAFVELLREVDRFDLAVKEGPLRS